MVNLYYALIAISVLLLLFCIRSIVKIIINKAICELPSNEKETTFTISESGKYSIWLKVNYSIRLISTIFGKTKTRDLGISVMNRYTGEKLLLNESNIQTTVSGLRSHREERYLFEAPAGEYIISYGCDERVREPLDISIQVRKYNSPFKMVLAIFGIILSLLIIITMFIMLLRYFG